MKPLPKQEIVIKKDGTFRLFITTNSNNADQFVRQHASEFGQYFAPSEIEPTHILYIRAGYDINEVEAYLLAMENEDTP